MDSITTPEPVAVPQSFADVIGLWPNLAAFDEEVGAPKGRGAAWRHRDSIPDEWWLRIVGAASERGFHQVTLKLLAELAERRRGAREAG